MFFHRVKEKQHEKDKYDIERVAKMNCENIRLENGMVNRGSWFRLKRVMKKAMNKEAITVGFLGGSITQGCLSSTPETCYAYLVYEWWQKKFPDTDVTYVNAGIGGTTSQFGVARVEDDLLSKKIDFTIVEFSVNDESTSHFEETYEGLLRKIHKSKTQPAMLIVNSVCYDSGENAQAIHNKLGRIYNIPCVSMKKTIYEAMLQGQFTNRDITQDDLHPNDLGHKLMAGVICDFLEKVYEDLETEEELPVNMPEPVTANGYEASVRYQNNNYCPQTEGFIQDKTPQNDIREIFRNGWTADRKGAWIKFSLTGSCFAAQYRKSVNKPTPVAKAVVDGDTEHAIILDGNFDEDWGDCLYITTLAEYLPYKEHTIEIIIENASEQDKVPFYLVSVIGS